MTRRMLILCGGTAMVVAAAAAVFALPRDAAAPVRPVRIVATHPHDPRAFTQGLAIADGVLYETTGLYGESTLRRVDLGTGVPQVTVPLPAEVFGEGMTVLGDELFVLTWENRLGYVFDRATLRFLRTFRYGGEGWGLTDNGTSLILSDGTPTLRFLDPRTAAVTRRLTVRDGGRPVEHLNELEYINGEIWANIWYSPRIARIDPTTGTVVGWLDATPLLARVTLADRREDVLNGIAWDADAGKLYLTGKKWPSLFEVKVGP